MRLLTRVLLLAIVVALVLPFFTASQLVDQKGMLVPGQVVGKDEWITVSYSSWTRHAQVQVKYQPPDGYGVAFLNVNPDEKQFDQLRKGDRVDLHYLLAKDLPNWPGMKTMRQMHLLPMARLATQHTWIGLSAAMEQARGPIIMVTIVIILLLVWRVMRLPYFSWAVVICVLTAIVWSMVTSFPRPTPEPTNDVKIATGTVKSVEYWKRLFDSSQSRDNLHWIAAQPIAVVGVEFIPEGRQEPVVAVDLIDEGSVSGLAEHARVSVDYEDRRPRVAHIRGAQRQFAHKNLNGLFEQVVTLVLVALVLWGATRLFGRLIRKLTRA